MAFSGKQRKNLAVASAKVVNTTVPTGLMLTAAILDEMPPYYYNRADRENHGIQTETLLRTLQRKYPRLTPEELKVGLDDLQGRQFKIEYGLFPNPWGCAQSWRIRPRSSTRW